MPLCPCKRIHGDHSTTVYCSFLCNIIYDIHEYNKHHFKTPVWKLLTPSNNALSYALKWMYCLRGTFQTSSSSFVAIGHIMGLWSTNNRRWRSIAQRWKHGNESCIILFEWDEVASNSSKSMNLCTYSKHKRWNDEMLTKYERFGIQYILCLKQQTLNKGKKNSFIQSSQTCPPPLWELNMYSMLKQPLC